MVLPTQNLTSASAATMPVTTTCGNCNTEERKLLHHVRHRGIFRRLCTSCVLRLHPQYFCPTCFDVYHPSPPPSGQNDAVTCLRCYSSSHSRCVPNPPTDYLCPICINPNSPIFVLKETRNPNLPNNEISKVIDMRAATILLAAAKIAAISMNNAATAARAEAERKAKEAAISKKRAREALEEVIYLAAREKMKRNQALLAGVVNSRGINLNGVGMVVGDGTGAVAGAMPEMHPNMERMDSSNEVLAALNSVELREKQRLVSGQSSNNGGAMNIGAPRVASSSITMNSSLQNHHTGASVNEIQQGNAMVLVQVQEAVPIQILDDDNQMHGVENGHNKPPQ